MKLYEIIPMLSEHTMVAIFNESGTLLNDYWSPKDVPDEYSRMYDIKSMYVEGDCLNVVIEQKRFHIYTTLSVEVHVEVDASSYEHAVERLKSGLEYVEDENADSLSIRPGLHEEGNIDVLDVCWHYSNNYGEAWDGAIGEEV